jgi:hypothetical protein
MAKTYEPIASTTLGADAASVTFSDLPGTFTDLVIVIHAKVDGNDYNPAIRFNGDTGSNYSRTTLSGNGSAAASGRQSSQTYFNTGTNGDPTNAEHMSIIHVMSYANTNVFKTILTANATPAVSVSRHVGLWRSTSAITSVLLSGSSLGAGEWVSGGRFDVYGIKAA